MTENNNVMRFVCGGCGNGHDVETFARINVAERPELKARVKDGSLFVWECPHCGMHNLAKYQVLYHDPEERVMLWLLPEGALPETCISEVENALSLQIQSGDRSLDGYVLRRVKNVGDLIEKVNIFDSGLDDVVMEMCKYVTRMEIAGKEKDSSQAGAVMDAPFRFCGTGGADNEITLSFPLNGGMRGVSIGFNVYEDCRGILQRNPAVKPAKGFARVDAEWTEKFFR